MSGDGLNELFVEVSDADVRRAVAPEVGDLEGAGGELTGDGIVVRTDDLSSLRAALNGWTRLVSVASETDGRL